MDLCTNLITIAYPLEISCGALLLILGSRPSDKSALCFLLLYSEQFI